MTTLWYDPHETFAMMPDEAIKKIHRDHEEYDIEPVTGMIN